MRQHLKWALPLVAVVAVIVACQDIMRPTESTPPAQGAADGQARTMVSPSPVVSVVPGIPPNIPIPGPGSSAVPSVVPGTLNVSTTTTSTTSTSTTSTTSTSTTSTTFRGCPPTATLDSEQTPFPTSGSGQGPAVFAGGFDDRCEVQTVEISFRATRNPLPPTMEVRLRRNNPGGAPPTAGVFAIGTTDAPPTLVGPELSSACLSLTFRDGEQAFSAASPPYNGVFRPFDRTSGLPNRFTPTFRGQDVNGTWVLEFFQPSAGGPISVTCFQIRFTLALVG